MIRRIRSSFGLRLTVLTLVTILLPFVLALFFLNRSIADNQTLAVEQGIASQANSLLQTVNTWDEAMALALSNMSGQPDIVSMNEAQQKPVLEQIVRVYQYMYLSLTLDPTGNDLARSDDNPTLNYADRYWFQQAAAGVPLTREAVISRTTGRPVVSFSAPILDEAGQVLGVAFVGTELTELAEEVGATTIGETGYGYLVDEQGRLLAHPTLSTEADSLIDLNSYPPVAYLMSGQSGLFNFEDQDGIAWIAYVNQADNGWGVIVQQQTQEAFAPAQALLVNSTLISIVAFLIVGILVWIVANRVIRPVQDLTQAATTLAEGNFQQTIPVKYEDEIGILANAFNSMGTHLQTLIDNLEQRVAARTRDLTISAEVSRSLSTILDQKQLVSEVAQRVRDAFDYYHVQIYLLDEATQQLQMVGGTGQAGQVMLAAGHALALGQGLVGQAAASKTAVLVPDTTQDKQWLPNPLLPDTRSELAVPILLGDQLLGVLDVQHNVTNGLTNENANLLQAVASQVAIALQNARQLTEIQINENRFALVIAGANQGIWDWYIPTNQVYFSPRWKEMIGYADDEIRNDFTEFENRLHPDDHDRVMQTIDDYLHGRIPTFSFEFRMQHKDGSYRQILVRASLERDKQGAPLRLAGSHTDITEAKEAEERLRASQERFALAVAGTNDGIWDWDIRTNQVYFSPRWKAMIGYADDEISNDFAEFEDRLHPDDHDFVMQQVDDYLNGRIPTYEYEFRIRHKNGSYRWILVRAAVVRDEQGAPLRMAGSHTDITARKEAEETIRQEQARTQAILESVTTPLLITRLDGSLIFANERAAEMVGLTLDKLGAFTTVDFYVEPAARQEVVHLLQTQGFVNNYELRLRRHNGDTFWGLISSRIFNFQGEMAIVSSIVDITARREVELSLALRARELQTVAQVGTAAATILEPERLLQEVVDLTKNQFELYHAHIYLLDKAGDALLLHTGSGEVGRQMAAEGRKISLLQEKSLVARAARSQQGVLVNDVRTEPDFLANPLLPDTRAELVVPLIAGSQVLGVLDVHSEQVGRFSEDEVTIFTVLASQVAVALQNARRYNDAQHALDELTRIQRVLVREGWQAFLTAQERPLQGFHFDRQDTHPITQQETVNGDVTLPLAVRGQTIGQIGVRNPSGAPLTDSQRQLLATLTNQVSEALERARLSEQTQIALTEAETLSRLSARLNAAQNYEQINAAVTDILRPRTNNTLIALLFDVLTTANNQPEWLVLTATNDETGVTDSYQRFPVTTLNPQPVWTINEGKPVVIANAQTDPRLNANERAFYKQTNTASIIFLPLRLSGRWLGLFSLAWREPVAFTAADERLFSAMLDQLMLAVNSLQLLGNAQKRAHQEQLLREISTRVSAAVDAQSVLQTATREIGRALGLETFVYLKNPHGPQNGQ
jgi:PAS domain S-box-containing protein